MDDAPPPPRRGPDPDLVSFEPTVTDSRRFTVGLWGAEAVLTALVLGGILLRADPDPGLRVGAACLDLAWVTAVWAIALRGRLQPMPGWGRRILAVVGVVALVAWAALFALVTTWPVALLGLVVWHAALVLAYRARLFRWRVSRAAAHP